MASYKRCYVFDLDGTLMDSGIGILNAVRYALNKMGREIPPDPDLRKFLGPPLVYSFQTVTGMTEEEALKATEAYRETYLVKGLFENRVYPGIRRLLRTLRSRGDWVAVATGKPQKTAETVIRYFGVDHLLDRVVGAWNESADKEQLIRKALPERYEEAWMIGDRDLDVLGGRKVGIHTVGAGWGYAADGELKDADAVAETVQDAIDLLCGDTPAPRGFFMSMEGLDGSGKSTQLRLLTEKLEQFGFELQMSREPGGCKTSEAIRDILLSREYIGMTAETEAILYAAARAQHVREVIRPALAAGKLFLSDRFLDSSVAYQGGGRELGVDRVLAINSPAVDGTMPDLTVYLDIDHRTALSRRSAASELDRIEMEKDSFHARVEEAYHELIRRDPGRFVVADAKLPPEALGETIARQVLEKLMEAER